MPIETVLSIDRYSNTHTFVEQPETLFNKRLIQVSGSLGHRLGRVVISVPSKRTFLALLRATAVARVGR